MAGRYPELLTSVRGAGLIIGAVLTPKGVSLGADIVNKMFAKGFLMNFTGNAVLRFVPPLIVSKEEIDEIIYTLGEVLTEI